MASTAERDARLSALKSAVEAWAAQRKDQVQKVIAYQKKIRASRGELTQEAAKVAEEILVSEISNYTS